MTSPALKVIGNNGFEEPILKDKDGNGEKSDIIRFIVDVALNGFVLNIEYDDGSVLSYVHTNLDDVLKQIKDSY